MGGGDTEQGGNQTQELAWLFGRGALPPTLALSRSHLRERMEGVVLSHSQQVTGGWLWDRGNSKRRGCPGRCPCLLLHPPPHDTGWQSPQTTATLGSHTFPRAGLQPQIAAGWVGLTGLRQEVRTNFREDPTGRGRGAALVNKMGVGEGAVLLPHPPSSRFNSHNRQWGNSQDI